MKQRDVLGHIDCPTCGHEKAMRVTPDKNGDPFGFCEVCRQQLRVGGDAGRVEEFRARYPWADRSKKPAPAPVTVSATVAGPQASAPAPVATQPPAPEKKSTERPRSAFADAVALLGGRA